MKTQVSVKTITEVDKNNGDFSITCSSDLNDDGNNFPSLFKSQVLSKPMEIDSIDGLEGELMLSHSGKTVGKLESNGNLTIEIEDDDASKYDKINENLIYNE